MNNNQEKSFWKKINSEQNVRYALLLIIGLFGGWIMSNIYSGFMIYPYINTNHVPNGNNGNGDTTTTTNPYSTTTPSTGQFLFIQYEEEPYIGLLLIHGGVGSYPVTEIYFRMQILESSGAGGVVYINCYVKTTTGVEYGGIASVYVAGHQTLDHSFVFNINSEHYDLIDWSTAKATIVTG